MVHYFRIVNETARGYGFGRLNSGGTEKARIAAGTACLRRQAFRERATDHPKNKDTWCKVLVGLWPRIRFNPKSPDVKSGSHKLFSYGVGYSKGGGADDALHIMAARLGSIPLAIAVCSASATGAAA